MISTPFRLIFGGCYHSVIVEFNSDEFNSKLSHVIKFDDSATYEMFFKFVQGVLSVFPRRIKR